MDGENSGQGCLFGFAHSPRKGERGRPPHVWTQETSNKVKLLLALGWSNGRIANALGVTEPTLRKHYFSELKVRALARDAMNAERAWQLWRLAAAGNVGAIKTFDAFVKENDRMIAGNAARTGEGEAADQDKARSARAAKPVPVGKKEEARQMAENLIQGDPDLMPLSQQAALKLN